MAANNERPFYPAGNDRPRPFLPFARFDDDPDILSSIQDLNLPLLANTEWQPHAGRLHGGFGYVERASWNKQNVAVKFLKSSQTVSGTARGKKSFRREPLAWQKLAHPSILPFIGVVCVDNMYLGMVSPYMSNGSAPKYLTSNPDADVLQIANVLIDQGGRACICGFGLSRFMKDFMSADTAFGGTIRSKVILSPPPQRPLDPRTSLFIPAPTRNPPSPRPGAFRRRPSPPSVSFGPIQYHSATLNKRSYIPLVAKDPWTLNQSTAYIMSTGVNEAIASHTNDDDQKNVGTVTLPTTAKTVTQNMARTIKTTRKSTGGKAPQKSIASKRTKQTPRKSSGSSSGDGNTIVVTSAELIPRVPRKRKPPLPPKPVTPGLRRSTRLRQRRGEVLPEPDTTTSTSSTAVPVDERPFYPADVAA